MTLDINFKKQLASSWFFLLRQIICKELQNIEVIVAPSLLTEGKVYQKDQNLGMYK